MKKTILIFILISSRLFSQTSNSKNNYVFLEGLGCSGYYSLNYEKTLFKGKNYRDFLRVGLSVFPDDMTKVQVPNKSFAYYLQYNIPIIIGTENGIKQLKYEYGIGIVTSFGEPVRQYNLMNHLSSNRYGFNLTGNIGIRYYLQKIPMFFRLTYTPLYDLNEKTWIPIWFGASIGYKF